MRPLALAIFSLFVLAACDSGPVEPDGSEPSVAAGTLTGFLNGEPYEAPAIYRTPSSGIAGIFAQRVGPPPSYRTVAVSASYRRGPLVEGDSLPLFNPEPIQGGYEGVLISELLGDAQVNFWVAVEGTPLYVVEVDSVAGRLRATFESTFVAFDDENKPFQTLPDTLRFTDGEFVIDLYPKAE